ncbi:MAG: glycoside hydrolase family 104 protein [Cyanobacteria bacterium MAG CAR1_bin_15]|nr:glycoside hydrolase family 104 protein [Cyanobacteria bacterium MAG CAR1_bin_15]
MSAVGTALALTATPLLAQTSPVSPSPTTAFHGSRPVTMADAATPRRYLHDHSNGMEALLRTIRFAEGTWRGGAEDGYQVIYGGRLISEVLPGADPFSSHPDHVVRKQNALNSSAAGAYQFMGRTWNNAARWLSIEDFSPHRQDQVARWLVRNRLSDEEEANIARGILTREALHQLAPEWAALPTRGGGSYYGYDQHMKSWDELKAFYDRQLALLKRETGA